jgi:L-ascorbate metabolism protein UlaG (beta-lactamase superfamily)
VYFAGDSGYAPHFAGVRERHGAPDLALIPIGAYEPRWIMKPVHLNPEEAVQASLDLGARTVLGTHWGTFILTDEPMDEPPRRFIEEAARRGLDGARVLPVGGTLDVAAGAQP